MKKKIIIIIACIVVVLAAIGLLISYKLHGSIFLHTKDYQGKVFGDSYYDSIDILNNKLNTKMFLFGDDIVFDKDVVISKIDTIDKFTLPKQSDYVILIVNESKKDLGITTEMWKNIKELLDKNLNFFFYYYGTRNSQKLIDCGIFDINTFQEGDLCEGSVVDNGSRIISGGIVVESELHIGKNKVADKYRPGQLIIEDIGFNIESNF